MDGVVRVFDTTLRDGEQAPGGSLSSAQKVELARRLDRLGVDVIEAGFPAASPGDLESVEMVAEVVDRAEVAALARCVRRDIDAAAKALVPAKNPVLHVFVATSDIHLKHKLRCSREEVIAQIAELVSYARSFCPRVEFSAEDATRTDWDFLVAVCEVAARAGATTINLPDTVGYSFPDEHAEMFRYMLDKVDGAEDITFSAHCHDDLGLATANTLAAISGGARQVELTVNGLGERAGNAPLEEVVMALKTRGRALGLPDTAIDSRQLVPTSQLVTELTGLHVQVNKSVVGANAFAHEAGIHQDGFLKERTTYEIMLPEDVGWESSRLVLGKHSGRHGVDYRLRQLGHRLDKDALDGVYRRVIEMADAGKAVDDDTLRELVLSGNGKSHRVPAATLAGSAGSFAESSQ